MLETLEPIVAKNANFEIFTFFIYVFLSFFVKIAVPVVKLDVETPTKGTGGLKHF